MSIAAPVKHRLSLRPLGERSQLLLGTAIAALLSYVAVSLSARLLGPADFGLLGALVGAVSLLTVVLNPLASTATHVGALARLKPHAAAYGVGLTGPTLVGGAVLAVVGGVVIVLWSGPLTDALHSAALSPLLLLAPLAASVAWIQVFKGLLSGLQRFTAFATATALEALVRAGVVVPLVVAFGVAGGVGAYLAGMLAAIVFALVCLGGLGWALPPRQELAPPGRTALGSALLTMILGLLQSADIIVVRWYGAPVEAGLYAGAAALGNALFTLIVPLTLPTFSRTLAASEQRKPTLPILLEGLVPVGLIGIGAVLAAIWLGGEMGVLIFGPAFVGIDAILIAYLAKTAALLVLAMVGQYAFVVAGPRPLIAPAAVAVCGPLVLIARQPDGPGAALVMCGATLAALAVLVGQLLVRRGVDQAHGRVG